MLLIFPDHPMSAKSPWLGLAYIAATLEKAGEKVEVIDCQVCRDYKQKIIESLNRHSQIGISTIVGNFHNAKDIANLIRKVSPQAKIIMGGGLASSIYDKLIPEYADIVIIGEGEDTISELIHSTELSTVKGIAYSENGACKTNPPRPLISNLDKISFPAWHLFNNYEKYNFRKRPRSFTVSMITSRGCPYQCIYCTKIIHGVGIRLRSIDNIIDEITYMRERFKVQEFRIFDENFTFYPERVKEICAKIISKRYRNLYFALPTGIRADRGDREMFKLMARAGFYWIGFGIESGSPEVQRKIKHDLDLNKAREIIKMAKETGIKIHIQFLLGLPFDTLSTMQQTIEFAKSLPVDEAHFAICIPFEGTELHEMVKKDGRIIDDSELYSAYSFSGKLCYEVYDLKSEDVKDMYRKAYLGFYFRPHQIKWLFGRVIRYNLQQLIAIWKERRSLF